jgi:hypothetical protein
MRRVSAVCVSALVTVAAPAAAQTTTDSVPATVPATRTPKPVRSAITISPFTILLANLSGDVEHRVGSTTTIGIGGTLNLATDGEGDDDGYRNVEAKVRFYPSGDALRGFAVGLAVGRNNQRSAFDFSGEPAPRRWHSTLGTEVSYQWLDGRKTQRERFVFVIGAGLKRSLGGGDDRVFSVAPTARLNIGIAF